MSHVSHFWELILGTVVALLPIINPFASTPVFLAITEGDTHAQRERQARMGCIYMVAILVLSLMGGTFIMNFFGISIPGLRIAGGLLVCGIGMSMLAARAGGSDERERDAARAKVDISFTPLAMPMLSGPGSIAVTIGFTSLARHPLDYAAIILGILVVAVISYTVLRLSGQIVRLIGVNGMSALTKIMGFLLLCIGIQFVVNGILGIATDPALLKGIRDVLQSG
ncbi:MAG TPA: MarC family NAAT transporter [Opitutaceae bacterium]|jgi:multiple antibiotic resistance protein|nr:MarC family NAAT transporter [Opitutaceae bacterium]HRE08825.1 MarC family NAAT transporter [Opitutaceae bacterium]